MESSVAIASIVFASMFGSALLGMFVRTSVPVDHLNPESKDVVKLAMGLIATMAALVLGLLTASAKSSFDTLDSEIKQSAAHIILLDRVLAQYGPETKEVRDLIRRVVAFRLRLTWPEDTSQPAQVDTPETTPSVEGVEARIRGLSPQNDSQRWLQSRALTISGDLAGARWLVFAQAATRSRYHSWWCWSCGSPCSSAASGSSRPATPRSSRPWRSVRCRWQARSFSSWR